jgi:translation initiation factor 2B subunit (eIF-2B alpha/beta/delta family)
MKIIKSFKIFEKEFVSSFDKPDSEEEIAQIKDLLGEFNQKKGILNSIFNAKDKDRIRLESDILSKVYSGDKNDQNRLLKKFESVLWIEWELKNSESDLKSIPKEKSKLLKEKTNLEKVSLVVGGKIKKDISNSLITIQNKLDSIEEKNKNLRDKIENLKKKIDEEKEEFSRFEKEIYTKIRSQE